MQRHALAAVAALVVVAVGAQASSAGPAPTGDGSARGAKITGAQVRNGSLTGTDLRDGSVTGRDIADGSLLAQDLAAGQLVPGPPGPKGDKGDQGDRGLQGPAGSIAGTPAGGVLTGTYPSPQLSSGARGVALAGVVVTAAGAVETWFNRVGGAPTVTLSSTGNYLISFPGVTAWYLTTPATATLLSIAGMVSVSTTGGQFYVRTYNASGAATNAWFTMVAFPASPTG